MIPANADQAPQLCVIVNGRCCEGRQEQAGPPSRQPVVCLSRREMEIIRLVALGYPSRAIGELLGLSVTTVQTYRNAIHNKLRVRGRADYMRFALMVAVLGRTTS